MLIYKVKLVKMNNLKPNWNVSNSVKVLVTTKDFDFRKNFNIAYEYEKSSIVRDNIEILRDKLLPSQPFFVKQVHGKKVVNIDKDNFSYVADGIITQEKNKVIGIKTADCIPIIISSLCGSTICILHVGRKGLEFNIIQKACSLLENFKLSYEAWIGPCISKEYYLVGSDIKDTFEEIDKRSLGFFKKNGNLFSMDLAGLASLQLNDCNISNIFYSDLCTVKNEELFFSHRGFADRQRFGTFVWVE